MNLIQVCHTGPGRNILFKANIFFIMNPFLLKIRFAESFFIKFEQFISVDAV